MPHGRKKKVVFWDNTGVLQASALPTVQSTFFLLQRSFNATTLHNPQVFKATPTHALNDPEALN